MHIEKNENSLKNMRFYHLLLICFFNFENHHKKVCLMCASTSKKFDETIITQIIKFYNIVMIHIRHISKKLFEISTYFKLKNPIVKPHVFEHFKLLSQMNFFDMCLMCIITIL